MFAEEEPGEASGAELTSNPFQEALLQEAIVECFGSDVLLAVNELAVTRESGLRQLFKVGFRANALVFREGKFLVVLLFLGLEFGLPDVLGIFLPDGLLQVAVKPVCDYLVLFQVYKPLARNLGVRVLYAGPNLLDPSVYDALGAIDFREFAGSWCARFQSGEQDTAVEAVCAILALKQGVFCVISVAEFAAEGGFDRAGVWVRGVWLPKDGADFGGHVSAGAGLTSAPLHYIDSEFHQFARVEFELRRHGG
jgi:hypothetical protein